MYIRFLFFILLIFPKIVSGQADREIYSKALKDFVKKRKQPNIDYSTRITLVIREKCKYLNINDLEYSFFKKNYNKLQQETYDNFLEKNQDSLITDTLLFDDFIFVFIRPGSNPDWQKLQNQNENLIQGVIEVSIIGFNEKCNQALFYLGFDFGDTGYGCYYVYEFTGKKWKQKGFIPSWTT